MEAYETLEYKGYKIIWDYDEYPESPRDWDGNISHMACKHRYYTLGDEQISGYADEYLRSLVSEFVSDDELYDFLVGKKGDCFIIPDEENGDEVTFCDTSKYTENFDKDDKDGILGYAIDQLSCDDCTTLLEPYMEIDTIAMYEHSGITVWIGGKSDPWDSGIIGFIYQTKEDTIRKQCATEENWREIARKNMEAEMNTYDDYVRGNVFDYVVEDPDGDVVDSCGGFYGTKAIDDQMKEIKCIIDDDIEEKEAQRIKDEIAEEIRVEENMLPVIDFSCI